MNEQDLKDIYTKALEERSKLLESALTSMIHKSLSRAEYCEDDKKKIEAHEYFSAFGNRDRWDYYGILSEKELAQLSLLDHLLNKNSQEVHRYPTWKKPTPTS